MSYSLGTPDPLLIFIATLVTFIMVFYQAIVGDQETEERKLKAKLKKRSEEAEKRLMCHSDEEYNEQKLIKINNIYVATGYGASNCVFIEGKSSCVVVDALDSEQSARAALKAFRFISAKPISAVILTHFHPDHVSGWRILRSANENVTIYVHQHFGSGRQTFPLDSIGEKRRRFFSDGALLGHDPTCLGNGIGQRSMKSRYQWNSQLLRDILANSISFESELDLKVGDIDLKLMYSPGESDDHLIAWLPESKTLFCGKNFYKSFPNVNGFEGGLPRDVNTRIDALNQMLDLEAEILIPSCTRPVPNKEDICNVLIAHRDAIQFVHDQTVRHMNKGSYAAEMVEMIHLPPTLIDHSYLQEFHGTVENMVRGILSFYMGWFSGNPSDLHPLTSLEEAQGVISLAGNEDKLFEVAKKALEEEKEFYQKVLRKIAKHERSAVNRNWYLTHAKMVDNSQLDEEELIDDPLEILLSLNATLEYLSTRIGAAVDNMTPIIQIELNDTKEKAMFQIRNGILDTKGLESRVGIVPDICIQSNLPTWKEILSKKIPLHSNISEFKVSPNLESIKPILAVIE